MSLAAAVFLESLSLVKIRNPTSTSSVRTSSSPCGPTRRRRQGGGEARDCTELGEQDWWEVWKLPFRNSILSKKRGWVTVEDCMEVAMGLDLPVNKDWESGNEWSWK